MHRCGSTKIIYFCAKNAASCLIIGWNFLKDDMEIEFWQENVELDPCVQYALTGGVHYFYHCRRIRKVEVLF